MPTPTQKEWRNLSTTAKSLTPHEVMTRMMWCLATMVSQTNPDGSAKGS